MYAAVNFAATETTSIPASVITWSHAPGSVFPVGTTTVTATATNIIGVSACSFTVTVNDQQAPVISCPANATVDCNADISTEGMGSATATDNCTVSTSILITYTDVNTQNSSATNAGHYNYVVTRTWKAMDAAGNFSQCTQTITVRDVTAPVITCPADVTINCDGDKTPAGTGSATATDNCMDGNLITISYTDVSTQVISPNDAGHYNYSITRTWKATDAAGNFSTCVQTITVHDVSGPVITCPANINVNSLPGQCQATVIVTSPAVTDNCTTLQLGNGLNFDGVNDVAAVAASSVINTENQGKRTVEVYFRVNDKSISSRKQVIWEEGGNSNGVNIYVFNNRLYYGVYSLGQDWNGTWLSTPNIQSGQWHNAVLVYDGTLVTGRLKAYLDGNLVASADAGADLGSVINIHPNSNAVGALSQNGIFHDGVQLLNLGHFFGGDIDEIRLWTIARTAAELQSTNTKQLQGNEPGLVLYDFNQGTACGNNPGEDEMQDRSTTQPTPLNGTMQGFALTGGCTSNWTNGSPALNSSITLTNSYTHTSDASGTYPVGTTEVVWTATDAVGNTSTCTQAITVADDQPPVAICKPATVYLDANGTAAVSVTEINNGSNDICGPVTLSIGGGTGTICGTIGEGYDLVMTAPAGAVFTKILFAKAGLPAGACGAFTTTYCHSPNSKSIVEGYALGHNTFTINADRNLFGDYCNGIYKRLYVQAEYTMGQIFDCSNRGANNVTLTVTDASGNTANCTAVVTVLDTIRPIITCPGNINIIATSAAGAVVNYDTPVATVDRDPRRELLVDRRLRRLDAFAARQRRAGGQQELLRPRPNRQRGRVAGCLFRADAAAVRRQQLDSHAARQGVVHHPAPLRAAGGLHGQDLEAE